MPIATCAPGWPCRPQVLPPLLVELRSPDLAPLVLPVVLRIATRQAPDDFAEATLPALRPLLVGGSGEALLLLVREADALDAACPRALAAGVVPPLLARALEHGAQP
jgi:hypothetical protein